MKKLAFFIIAILMILTIPAQKKAFKLDDLYRVKNVSSPVLSNNGKMILFTVSESDLKKAKSSTQIYLMNSDGSGLRQLTSKSANFSPFWGNDNRGFYFTSYRNGSGQVFYMSLEGGDPLQITDFSLGIDSPKLSPDGNYFVFSTKVFPEYGIDEEKNNKTLEAMGKGPIQAHLADSLFVRHWTEYNDGQVSHVILYDIKNKKYTDLTPGEWDSPTFAPGGTDDFNFSPDSKEVVFTSKRVNNPESSTNSDVWTININGSGLKNITSANTASDTRPKYSPDGKYIAYLTQLVPGYESDRIRLAVFEKATGKSTIITDSFDNWVSDFEWADDSKSIYFTGHCKGYTPVYKVTVANHKIETILDKHSINGFAVPRDEKNIYFNYTFCHKPVEIAKFEVKTNKLTDLTTYNKTLSEEIDIRPAEQVWVDGSNGKKVHMFIVKPYNFDPNKKYPVVINVHGGPQMQWQDSFRGDWQVYPGSGYIVAYPNPHGSTGYGQEFTLGISGDWDGKVYEDVMKVTDYLETLPYVDKSRIGAMGWSYGGYFMNLLQAKTKRYKCLASMMGIYDLEQFYLETEELWFPEFDLKGDPYTQKALYDRMSPSKYVDNFSTPTLIITGERDYRISYTQSLRYFTALQKKGIDSRLIVYKNDGHWPAGLKSMPLYYNAHLDWFHKYLGGEPAPYDTKKMVKNIAY